MIIFRTDGNEKIGLGHLVRCLSLADYAISNGKEVVFIVTDVNAKKFIQNYGIDCVLLESSYDMLDNELEILETLLSKYNCEKLIIDSYFVTYNYLYVLNNKYNLLYIDDIAKFAYPVNELLNYNINAFDINYSELYKKDKVRLPKLYLGFEYLPLRKEFVSSERIHIKEKCNNVFVSTGGSDNYHVSLKMLDYIDNINLSMNFNFAVSEINPDKQLIIERCKDIKNAKAHVNSNIVDIMKKCDIAVSACGSTMNELCKLGIPTISYTIADNQLGLAQKYNSEKITYYVGDVRNNDRIIKDIFFNLHELNSSYKKRQEISDKTKLLYKNIRIEELFI